MFFKALTWTIVTFALWMIISRNFVNSALEIKSYPNSFEILDFNSIGPTERQEIINDAEQARIQHGTNLTKIADYMRGKFATKKGHNGNCFVNAGRIRASFYSTPYFIYMKSNTSDDMHIVCYRTFYDDCSGGQKKVLL